MRVIIGTLMQIRRSIPMPSTIFFRSYYTKIPAIIHFVREESGRELHIPSAACLLHVPILALLNLTRRKYSVRVWPPVFHRCIIRNETGQRSLLARDG